MPYANIKDRYQVSETFWNTVKANLTVADDIHNWEQISNQKVTPNMEDETLTQAAADLLPPEPWDENTFNQWMNALKEQSGKKGRELFHPVRKALTAQDNGPELKLLLPLIGRDKAARRLRGETA